MRAPNILIIGGGGREHALAWRLTQSSSVKKLFAAPGNPGIATVAECIRTPDLTPQSFLQLADSIETDLTVVGPEAPLVAGIVDLFRAQRKPIVGPTAAAARLEGSKIFAKQFMDRWGIPTARFAKVETAAEALAALRGFEYPVVIKADGLAAGKGVIIAQSEKEAESAVQSLGPILVIEEFLEGEEVSFIALSDGREVLPLEASQDHKTAYDGDTGPNTGGMGAYCDGRILNREQNQNVLDRIIRPAIDGMQREGNPFTGFLYAGLMMTSAGPKVLEFNVRLGDPEAQAILHRMDGDFACILEAAAHGGLRGLKLAWSHRPSVCIVMASEGYPGRVRTGDRITGIAEAEHLGAIVFHAGTESGEAGLETSGGRVLGVTASGEDLPGAIENAYAAVDKIQFAGMHYRRDIGRKGLRRW